MSGTEQDCKNINGAVLLKSLGNRKKRKKRWLYFLIEVKNKSEGYIINLEIIRRNGILKTKIAAVIVKHYSGN
jgi:hypothetical protein